MHFMKFNVVAAIGITVQLSTVWLLVNALGLRADIATAVAVVVTVLHNFIWHVQWTWAERAPQGRARLGALARFVAGNGLTSLVGNVVIVAALTRLWHVPAVAANAI